MMKDPVRVIVSVVSIFWLSASPSFSQEKAVDCTKDTSQMALNMCSYQRFQADDRVLNETYQSLTTKLDQNEKKYATAAQLAWIAFRDAECVSLSGGPRDGGGSIWPLLNNQCLSRLTRHRTQELKQQVSCPAGHLDCPSHP